MKVTYSIDPETGTIYEVHTDRWWEIVIRMVRRWLN